MINGLGSRVTGAFVCWSAPYRVAMILLVLAIGGVLISCETKSVNRPTQFKRIDAREIGIDFVNVVKPVYDHNILEYNYFYNGGGVGLADFNNDGYLDVFFSGNQVSCALYLNQGNMTFRNVTDAAGLATSDWATGVSVVDINGDGWNDIYVTMAGYPDAGRRKNRLYIHQGLGKDGLPFFKERSEAFGLADSGYGTHAAFFDFDRDGDLDVYVVNHWHDKSDPNVPRVKRYDGSAPDADRLYRNNGNETFTDVSQQAGIVHEGYGLSVSVGDLNGDHWPDIFVGNDFIFDDVVYINNRDGTFSERAHEMMKHQSQFSMGSDLGDFNNDLLMDLMVVDMMPVDPFRQKMMANGMSWARFNASLSNGYLPQHSRNMLHLNGQTNKAEQHAFQEIGRLSGVAKTDWSWAPLWLDVDNDGRLDLYITNGIPVDITNLDFILFKTEKLQGSLKDYDLIKKELLALVEELPEVRIPNFAFRNQGKLSFADSTSAWGLDVPSMSQAAAYGDLDNDGDLDLVVNNIDEPPLICLNQSDKMKDRHYLRIKLEGQGPNHTGIGAEIIVNSRAGSQIRQLHLSRGFQASQEPVSHFGLGKDSLVNSIHIIWPDGHRQEINNVRADTLLVVRQHTEARPTEDTVRRSVYFSEVTNRLGYTTKENRFDDFGLEPLHFFRLSEAGPPVAVGDLNGDHLEDFVLGGAARLPLQLFFQTTSGSFIRDSIAGFDAGYEDLDLQLFDADHDKDLDLFVASGGIEYEPFSPAYRSRLFLNNGQGKLTRSTAAIPRVDQSSCRVTAADYDNDGDLDLYLGGYAVAGAYPRASKSRLLQNHSDDRGCRFEDASDQSRHLQTIGLVGDAEWCDYNGDGWMDLIVAEKWGGISFFKNEKGTLLTERKAFVWKNETHDSRELKGWWNAILPVDTDGDGDLDLIAGNFGLNHTFDIQLKQPMQLFVKDFDKNGVREPIFSHYQQQQQVTLHGRDLLARQIPSLKKRFATYKAFAESSFTTVFSKEDLSGSEAYSVNFLQSVHLENRGDGSYRLHSLPVEAQFAPVRDILAHDVNRDGIVDLLLTGNDYGLEYNMGNQDASAGLCLLGDGQGGFRALSPSQSGFYQPGDGRHLKKIQIAGKTHVLTVSSRSPVGIFRVNQQ